MPAPSSLLAAAVASLLAGGVRSLTVVDWKIPSDGGPIEPLVVSAGETVRFEYDPGHNVVLHPTGTCDDAGGTYLGGTSPTEYVFGEAGLGTYTFACDVADGVHCDLGQIITITVTDAPSDENVEGGEEEEAVVANDGTGDDPGASIPAPPDEDPKDVLERFGEFFNEGEDRNLLEFRMKPYTVPSDVTTYVDFLFNIPEDLPEIVHIVAGDVIISQPKHLHHFVLTGCLETVDPAKEGLPQSEIPESCSIPLGGGWAVGGDFFGGIPSDSGEVFGAALGIKAISLNVHYTDGSAVDLRYPNDGANAIATDGFRMMYTTDLRPKTIVYRPLIDVGAGPFEMQVPPNDPRYFVTKTCTVVSGCKDLEDEFVRNAADTTCGEIKALCSPGNDALPASDLMSLQSLCPVSCGLCGDIGGDVSAVARSEGGGPDSDAWRVDAVKYHAHLIGREMYTTLLPNERSDAPIDLESQALWLYDNQVTYPFPQGGTDESHFKVFPGDKIQASCVYDSTSREGPTIFGQSTYDEMCITQVSVVIDTPDVSAGGGASLVALINSKTFNCAMDDHSDIWNGSLDAGEDAQDIWKDHPMEEADCKFPVGSPFGGTVSFKFDAFPTFEARCGGSSICDENEILNESAVAGETCSGGSMNQADSNDLSAYDAEGDATFGEQCSANGGSSTAYTCRDIEGSINYLPLDAQTVEYLRVSWWQPKCCTDISVDSSGVCDGSEILNESAVAGESCSGGSMNEADSNDPSAYDAEGDATFGEQCSANGGSSTAYTCKDVEGFINILPLDAQTVEYLRAFWWQPKCCTDISIDSSGESSDERSDESSGEISGNGPVKEATSGDDPDKDPSQGENDNAPGAEVESDGPDEAKSGSFAESPSLLFLLSAVACFLGNI